MPSQRLIRLAAVVLVVAALFLAKTVLVPVALAGFLTFVLSPLVTRLERWRLGRVASVLVVTLFTFVVIGLVGWLVAAQATTMVEQFPEYKEHLQRKVALLRDQLQAPLKRATTAIHDLGDGLAEGHSAGPAPLVVAADPTPLPAFGLDWVPAGLESLLLLLGVAGLVVILVILMLLQRDDLRDRFIALAGGGSAMVTTHALNDGARRLSRYLFAISLINGLFGVVMGVGLMLLDVPNSLLWGFLAAVLRFVPNLGSWIAASLTVVYALVIGDGWTTPLLVLALFVVVELVASNLVEPLVYQGHVGVSSTALVVSAVFWTWLWGVPGLVLATPMTVCLAVMGRHIPQMRFLSLLLGDQPVLSPAPRLYQRLLVMDPEEAWKLVAGDLKNGKSLTEVYDAVILPVLCMAQQDRREHVIDDLTLVKVEHGVRDLIDEAGDRDAELHGSERLVTPDAGSAPQAPLRVLCIPAGEAADGLVCAMVCQILALVGADAREVPHEALMSEALGEIASMQAEAVCVSQLPPLSFGRLRYLCKRLAQRFPEVPILIGTWTMNLDPDQARERIQWKGSCQFVGTLAEMQAEVQRLASLVRV